MPKKNIPEKSTFHYKNNKRKIDSSNDRSRIKKRKKLGFRVNDLPREPSSLITTNKVTNKTDTQNVTDVIDLSDEEEEYTEKCPTGQIPDSNPVILNHERITLFKKDLNCLKGKEWLKDNVVDLILNNMKKEYGKSGQAYLFNSLFFSKLRALKELNENKKCYYQETKRWFKNDTLSNKRFWIIPVCDRFHWYVIVVSRPRSNKPVIYVMDSMRKKSYESANMVKDFLKQKYAEEHRGKCKKINVNVVPIPQQTNASDCGLHAIRSASLFISTKAQLYHSLIQDYQNNKDKISKIYSIVPLPTRQTILQKIRDLIKTS